MITALVGDNTFKLHHRLSELVNKFVSEHGDLALERIDAEEAEAQAIIEAINSLPFLSGAKMVVVRNGAANKEFAEQIEQIIDSIPDSTEIVLYEPSIDKRTAYFKVLQKNTNLELHTQLDKNQLARWLVEEVKNQGAKISLSSANYLIERVGDNQQMLFSELTKLGIYSPDISKENIDLLTEPTPQSKVFDLLDAAFAGQKKQALSLYEDQRAQKVEPQAIMAMIAWQLHILALVKFAGNRSPAQISKDSGINPYPITKAIGLAKKIDDEQLRAMVDDAFRIDLKSKTTTYDLDEALKTYITTL